MTEEMTPYDRTYRCMAGEPVDRLPNQNILMAFAARYIGSTYDRLVQDYRVLVEGNLRAIEAFHIDWASAIQALHDQRGVRGAHGYAARESAGALGGHANVRELVVISLRLFWPCIPFVVQYSWKQNGGAYVQVSHDSRAGGSRTQRRR